MPTASMSENNPANPLRLQDALLLPRGERALLAVALLDSLEQEEPLPPEWAAVVNRRRQDVATGRVELRDADEVFSSARSALG
ncbi:MAG: addiction module protein [Kiritimatiellae bacterium]|nr:addiction module protein [Kiritimatiellia bacterium]